MTVANLGLAVDSSSVEHASPALDRMTAASQKAESAAARLGQASASSSTLMQRMLTTLESMERDLTVLTHQATSGAGGLAQLGNAASGAATGFHRLSGAMNAAMMQRRNLMFQVADIAQGIPLMFQSPTYGLFNLANQMTQVGQAYYGQGGMGAAFKDMGNLVGGLAKKIAPLGIVLGIITAGFAALTTEANRGQKVQVDFADIVVATWELATEAIGRAIKPFTDWLAGLWDWLSPHIVEGIDQMIRAFDLAFRNIATIWKGLPAALGEAVFSAANVVVQAVVKMVEGVRGPIIQFLQATATAMMPFNAGAASVANNAALQFAAANISAPPIENPFAGANKDMEREFGQNRLDVMKTDYVGAIFKRAREVHNRPSEEDMKKAAKEAERQAEAYAALTRGAQQFIEAQRLEAQTLGMTAEQAKALAYAQDLMNKAANQNIDLTPKMRAELEKLGADMAAAEQRTKDLTDAYNFGKDTFKGFFSDLKDDLMNSVSLWEAFGNAGRKALDKILDRTMDQALDTLFPALWGSLMGVNSVSTASTALGLIPGLPGHAAGTTSAPPGWAWTGEQGPELIRFRGGEQVLNNRQSMAAAANSNRAPSVVQVPHIADVRVTMDENGNWQARVAGISAQQTAKAVNGLQRNIGGIQADWQSMTG